MHGLVEWKLYRKLQIQEKICSLKPMSDASTMFNLLPCYRSISAGLAQNQLGSHQGQADQNIMAIPFCSVTPPRFRKRLPLDPIPTLHRSVQQRQPWETDAVCVKMMCLCLVRGMVIPPSMELFTGEPAETRFHEQSDMVSRRFSLERPSTNPETP